MKPDGGEEKPTASLWARAIFPVGLLQDASVGDRIERRAATRHNVAQIPHIRTYLWRWIALTWIAIGFDYGCLAVGWDWLAIFFGAISAGCGATAVWFGGLLFMLAMESS